MSRVTVFRLIAIMLIVVGCNSLKRSTPTTRWQSTTRSQDAVIPGNEITPGRQGKTSGQLKTKTNAEIMAEKRNARKEEMKRRRELQQRKRLEERAKRTGLIRSKSKRGHISQMYLVRAIMNINNEKHVLIDATSYAKGSEIMGRNIVGIMDDRIIINEYGRIREVKIGESVLPNLILPKTTKAR